MNTEYTSVFSKTEKQLLLSGMVEFLTKTGPVGGNPEWNLPNDYPFKDEVPVYITRGSGDDVTTSPDIIDWCERHNISRTQFNHPCILNCGRDCRFIFYGCSSFNQPLIIPDSVTDCTGMFINCESLNQPLTIPSSVCEYDDMFFGCRSLDRSLISGYKPEMA